MNKKIKIMGLCVLSSLFLFSCGKKSNQSSSTNSSSSYVEPPYSAKDVIIDDYASSCIKGSGSIYVNGQTFLETSSYLKDPTTYSSSAYQNIIRRCPISQYTGKVVVYTPDWWMRTTNEREDETVYEYVIRKNQQNQYVVEDVKNSTGTIVPLDGIVISIPVSDGHTLVQGQTITFDTGFKLNQYQTALYSNNGRRVPINEINPHYIGLNAATLYDVASDTKLVRSDQLRLNTVTFSYDDTKKAFIVKEFNQKTYHNDLNVPLDGFLLANQVTTANNLALKLEENVFFEKDSEVYFEKPAGLFNETITYKIGFQGQDSEGNNIGPNVEILTDNRENNEWGYEIAVVDGKVAGSAVNMEQPTNGYRIRFSAFDDAIENHIATLRDQFKVGVPVSYNSSTITVNYNLLNFANEYLASLKKQINEYIQKQEVELYDYDVEKVKELKSQFEANETLLAQLVTDNNPSSQYYYQSKVNYAKYLAEQAFLYSSPQEPVETRSAWHYPLSNPETLDTIKATIQNLKDANFNEVIVAGSIDETNNYGTAYTSQYAATAPSLSGNFGKYKDYLDAFIHLAHDAGLKVQVCMSNWFFYQAIIDKYPEYANYFATNYDGTNGENDEGEITKFLDPANEKVRSLYLNMYREIVEKYKDVDGFHLDYIRYGANNNWLAPNSQGYTQAALDGFLQSYPQYNIPSLEAFKTQLASNPTMLNNFSDYRRNLVTSFVSDVKSVANGKQLTIAVVSDAETAKSTKLQDWKTWLTNNYIDSIHLMAYYCDKGYVIKDSYAALEHANGMAYVVSGLSPIYSNLEIMELPSQIDGARSTKVQGTALFATHSFGNRPELGEYLNGKNGQGVYNQKAIVAYESVQKVSDAFVTTLKNRMNKYYKNSSYMNDSQAAAFLNDLEDFNKLTDLTAVMTKLNAMITAANANSYGTDAVKDRIVETLNYMKSIYTVKAYKAN